MLLNTADAKKEKVQNYVAQMCTIFESGKYPLVCVTRPWSKYNPEISGEFSRPHALKAYLTREFQSLLDLDATIKISASRTKRDLYDPALFAKLSEDDWDLRQKKLFLFTPERIDISLNRLEHYTGTRADDFQKYILFTNYRMHI
ncbi:MAG TPA: AMP nucleosidase, partial [Turneriella sp.]|nr:AMP nucleosidase [Turneriella sp.]